jgi:hypothetical protein
VNTDQATGSRWGVVGGRENGHATARPTIEKKKEKQETNKRTGPMNERWTDALAHPRSCKGKRAVRPKATSFSGELRKTCWIFTDQNFSPLSAATRLGVVRKAFALIQIGWPSMYPASCLRSNTLSPWLSDVTPPAIFHCHFLPHFSFDSGCSARSKL